MSTRPLAVLLAGVLALAAIGAIGCGDSSESDDDASSATSTDKSKASKSEDSTSEDSKSEDSKSDASTKPGVTFGQKSASGEAATAQTQGVIDNPEIVRLRVRADPPQNAMVSYTFICVVGGKAGGDSGQFSAKTPIDREIELPDGNPTECNVSANAKLDVGVSGKVTMKLRGRER